MRKLFVRGAKHRVFLAIRSDGLAPAETFFEALRRGEWRSDTDHPEDEGWPDSRQADDRVVLLRVINHFATTGTVTSRANINNLEAGVWEFKRASKRVTFYDTDGFGNSGDRKPNRDAAECTRSGDPFWHVPDFDPQLRLGWCFPKSGDRASSEDIQESLMVREEDLAHDRAA